MKIRCFPNFVKNGQKQNIVTTFMNFVDRFSSRRNVKLFHFNPTILLTEKNPRLKNTFVVLLRLFVES